MANKELSQLLGSISNYKLSVLGGSKVSKIYITEGQSSNKLCPKSYQWQKDICIKNHFRMLFCKLNFCHKYLSCQTLPWMAKADLEHICTYE